MLLANNGVRQRLSPSRLAVLAQAAAARHDWASQVRYDQDERWYQRLEQGDNHEVWLLSWLPGQRTGFHDHWGSAGAFAVVHGELREYTTAWGPGDRDACRCRLRGPPGTVVRAGVMCTRW